MKFSIAKTVITPQEPIYMAGFAMRKEKNIGIHDDIYMKTVLLQANQSLLIVTFDLIGGDRSFIKGIKEALQQSFGLNEEQILINFSHTHGSMYVTGESYPELRRGRYSIGEGIGLDHLDIYNNDHFAKDIEYFRFLRAKLIELVQQCFDNLEDGDLQLAIGSTDISVSRRLPTEDGIVWAPNYGATIDKDLTVIKLVNAEGQLKSVLFSHGCHPTSMNNREISAEFVGHACECLEQKYEGATAVFLQGCGSEIKPMASADGDRFKLCTFDEMEQAGKDFAADVVKVMETKRFQVIEPDFGAKLLDVRLPTQEVDVAAYERMLNDPDIPEVNKGVLRRLIEHMKRGTARDHLYIYISIWQFNKDTKLVALEHEISTDYSLMIKQIFKDKQMIVLGYSNGSYTYVPTAKIAHEGGYEADRAPKANLYRGPFIPEVEDIIIGQIVKAECLS